MQRTILIVEDDSDIRDSLREFLESEGHHVETATDGEQAFRILRERENSGDAQPPIDLILLDLMMPVMNGVEFRKRQAEHPEHSRIPVIVISADNRTQSIASSLGLRWCIQKPMSLEELLEAVNSAGREDVPFTTQGQSPGLRTGSSSSEIPAEGTWKR